MLLCDADENNLADYFGIISRVLDSNKTVRHCRTILVQCTLLAKRYSPYLRQYYERIKNHHDNGKAIIATARKFLGIKIP